MSRAGQHGRLFTFEGGEGAGKSTQIQILADHLEQQGYCVCTTREPGGTPLGESIRDVLMTRYDAPTPAMSELLLMFAARASHLEEVIEPALAKGRIVLCDRFTDASYAYQGVARQLGQTAVTTLESLVQGERRPDGTLLLDIPVETGLARAGRRASANRFDQEKLSFHESVRHAYLDRAASRPSHYAIIDASASRDQVSQSVIQAVTNWL